MLKGHVMREFDDGTEFTTTDFLVSTAVGAVIGIGVVGTGIAVQEFKDRRRARKLDKHNREMSKNQK